MVDDPKSPPPLTPGDAESIPTWRAAYSDRTSALMATFSQLAYVPFHSNAPDPAPGEPRRKERLGGKQQLADLLAPGKFELREIFDWEDVQAFLAVNPEQMAVLAFRGTANAADWKIDLNAVTVPMDGFPDVRVHEGFWKAFGDQRQKIKDDVDLHVPSTLGLYITGHSLGGALAQIASAVLERDNLAACYTYGSPRVASKGFDIDVKCPNYRLINHWDLVPGVPLPVILGYYHAGDPRLLAGPHPQEILRRDHWLVAWFWAQLRAVSGWVVTHTLYDIDDHMIWNYRTQLDEIRNRRIIPASARPKPRA